VFQVTKGLDWWRDVPGGAAWLERLPAIADELARRWSLDLGIPLDAHISLVLPAVCASGEHAVLKVNFPEPESECEADALATWNGDGAARLLARDDRLRALLVERLEPGTQLWAIEDDDEANRIGASVLRRLAVEPLPGHPYRSLAGEAERWAVELPERWSRLAVDAPRILLDEALRGIAELSADPAAEVLLHQDLHGGNILLGRDGWRAIDPKPLVGDPAFDAASLLRDRRGELLSDPNALRRVRRRLDLLANELALERERLRLWGVVHAVAWGVEADGVEDEMLLAAELLVRAR
jgi:streptomycin 6-kinase